MGGFGVTLLTGSSTGTKPPRSFECDIWFLNRLLQHRQIENKRDSNFLKREAIANITNYLFIIVDTLLSHICKCRLDIILHILFPSFPICFQGIISTFHFIFKFSNLFCKLKYITKREKLIYVFFLLSEITKPKLNTT